MHAVGEPEALGAAEERAEPHAMAGVGVDERVGEEAVLPEVALAEVRRQLQQVVAHSVPPMARPSAAAPMPHARLATTFATSAPPSPSSPRRWLSNIHVENV